MTTNNANESADEQLARVFRASREQMLELVARLVRSRAVAEEIVQDTFLAIWDHRRQWAADFDLRAYAFTSAYRRTLNYLRRHRTESGWEHRAVARGETWGVSQYTSESATASEVDEAIETLRRAVEALPPRLRHTVLLRLHWNLTNAEIAAAMGIGLGAVEKNVSRAIKVLRTAFRRQPNDV